MTNLSTLIALGIKNAGRNWKTTGFGILTLAATAFAVAANPAVLETPDGLAAVAAGVSAGVGLIKAKDSDRTGKAEGKR